MEPRVGVGMETARRRFNRILIIQLQQEFFPPGLGPALTDTSISTSAFSQRAACVLPRPPLPAPPTVGDSGYLLGVPGGLASAPSNCGEVTGS